LHVEEPVLRIPVAAPAAEQSADVAIDGLDLPDGDLLVTGGEEAVARPEQELGHLRDGWHAWPPEPAVRNRRAAPSEG
jgi:hypothetical protein